MSSITIEQSARESLLRQQFNDARLAGKRAKDAAAHIGISEGEAVALHCGSHEFAPKSVPLRKQWIELLQALEFCGPLMALTRNESTVHEKTGVYQSVSAMGHMGLALGEDIDLRLFFAKWHAGFAVTELAANPGNRSNISLQFFDQHGLAVHKIFSRDATDMHAWQQIAETFAEPEVRLEFTAKPAEPLLQADGSFDAQAIATDWSAMKDTHEFFGLLGKHAVERQQCFRIVENQYAQRVSNSAVRSMLMEASFDGTPIMVFVSSGGCIQIHTGPVKRIEPMEIGSTLWLNVLDPSFNLHLREDSIANVWVVEKPTSDGIVSSLEAFDEQGELMAMFFGARKPGKPELNAWRQILARLPRLAQVPAGKEVVSDDHAVC